MKIALLAPLMRALPTDIRRFDAIWHGLYASAGGGGYEANPELDARWPQALHTARLRCGYKAKLNLRDWLERRAFFSGRYYQTSLELLLAKLLQRGDTWVDIGANLGLVTLTAAARIGNTGKGFAFEPNPVIFERLTEHLKINGITNVQCQNVALGESDGTATLHIPKHSGQGSLVPAGKDLQHVDVPLFRGDNALRIGSPATVVVKIDVEGYELPVLRGIPQLLDHPNSAVIVELIESLLRQAGSSTEDVLALMRSHGFEPFEFAETTSRFAKSLKVTPLRGAPSNGGDDILFLKPGSALAQRVR